MEITELEIRDLKSFEFIDAKRLVWTPRSRIQVILGTNGSGKSSLLRQLSPRPPDRDDFGPNGYRRQEITHRGNRFVLTTDFSNAKSPHSFIMNEVELNDGGTTGVQKELVETHLGYTSYVNDMVFHGAKPFTDMTAGARKTHIMTISPHHLDFLLEQHKSVSKAIRACKNNLAMLNERKAVLEGQFLGEDQIQKLNVERENLSSIYDDCTKYVHRIDGMLSSFTPLGGGTAHIDYRAFSIIDEVRFLGVRWKDIDRTRYEDHLQEYRNHLFSTTTEIEHLQQRNKQIGEEITRNESIILEMDDVASRDALLVEIDLLTEKISGMAWCEKSSPISKADVGSSLGSLETVEGLVGLFVGCDVQLVPYTEISRMRQLVAEGTESIKRRNAEISQSEDRLGLLKKALTIKLEDVPADNCAKHACPLYAKFFETHKKNKEETEYLENNICRWKDEVSALERDVNSAREHLHALNPYIPHITELHRIINTCEWMRETLGGIDILKTLQRNPYNIYQRLKDRYDLSYQYHHVYQDARERLARKQEEKASRVDPDARERQLILQILEERKKEQKAIAERLQRLHRDALELQEKVFLHEGYASYRDRLIDLQQQLEKLKERLTKETESKLLSILRNSLEEQRATTLSRMSHIENTLQGQRMLRERYDEEVVAQIFRIEAEMAELIPIEESLSPTTGIPHRYAVTFMNAIFEVANYLIEMVFTYPLQISPLDLYEPLCYDEIAVIVGDRVRVKDISRCSAAQKEIINLTFDVASLIVRGYTDMPLMLDECGNNLDPLHKQQLISLLKYLVDEGQCSQLFFINHHAVMHEGMANTDVLVLKEDNIVCPPEYNLHVEIN